LEKDWIETKTDVEAYDWAGNLKCLRDVPAIRNVHTGIIRVYPSEVSKAEIKTLAENRELTSRDVPFLMLLYAKPGPFKGGEVYYKYHMNKMLFYLWKNLEKQYLGEAFPHDEFEAKRRGPVPKNLDEDLKRLEKEGIIKLSWYQWGEGSKDSSLKIELTRKGIDIAEQLFFEVAPSFREEALHTKEQIFPLNPKTVMTKVHREFPEYRKIYTEPDQE